MKVLCYKCGHAWNYKGKNSEGKSYITCSGCYYKIRLDRAIVEDVSQQELLTKLPSFQRELPKKLSKIPTTHYPKIDLKPIEIKRPIEIMKDVEEEEVELEEKTFTNIADFNLEIAKRGLDNLVKVIPIKSNIKIKIIPRDPMAMIKHQENYGRNIAN